MNLVAISPNVLVNPESIDCVEQRDVQGTQVTYVWIGDRDYVLVTPIEEFYKSLGLAEQSNGQQHFAG